MTFGSRWPGSNESMTLVSPSGRRYSSSTRRARHAAGPTFETYVVNHPQPGSWKVRLHGIRVTNGGEPVSLRVTRARTRPTARVQIRGRPRIVRGVVTLKLKCTGARYTCNGKVVISARERSHLVVILHTTFAALSGRTTRIPIGLSPAQLARLRRDRKARITVKTDPGVGARRIPGTQRALLKLV